MSIAHKIAELISSTNDGVPQFVDIGPECFAAQLDNGLTVINWQGQNYVLQIPTWRIRLRNWLISLGEENADVRG